MPDRHPPRVAIVGGGPAGLMAAEALCHAGLGIDVFDAMPSPGRKFLMAGKGGLNITHAEPLADFLGRYRGRQETMQSMLRRFGPDEIRQWMQGLGVDSFVGSSGRVFPTGMKAAPLLRAWLHRLRGDGVRLHMRHRWLDIRKATGGQHELLFATPPGEERVLADAVIFALGGGSWAKLGSDAAWTAPFARLGIPIAPLRPANCGFDVEWSTYLRERFAGQPVKNVAASCTDTDGKAVRRQGEFVITHHGVEGGLIYALSAPLREAIEAQGSATLSLDLLPGRDLSLVIAEVARPRAARSLASHLQGRLGLKGIKLALLHECLPRETFSNPQALGEAIKALPLPLRAPRPLDEAISSAGGVRFAALDEGLMLRELPGVFCAGEMLDWEAPTGGYLLTGCLSSGHAAGLAARAWLESMQSQTRTAKP